MAQFWRSFLSVLAHAFRSDTRIASYLVTMTAANLRIKGNHDTVAATPGGHGPVGPEGREQNQLAAVWCDIERGVEHERIAYLHMGTTEEPKHGAVEAGGAV